MSQHHVFHFHQVDLNTGLDMLESLLEEKKQKDSVIQERNS